MDMCDQKFNHENELLAIAPLNGEGDSKLFKEQRVKLTGAGSVQWDFILHDGADWHFSERMINLKSDASLGEFKQFIRYELKCIIEGKIS